MIVHFGKDIYSILATPNHCVAENTRNGQLFTRLCDGFWLDMHGIPMQHPELEKALETAVALQQIGDARRNVPRPVRNRPTYAPRHRRKPLVRPRNRKEGNRR